jgi:RNA polymerase sigma factor (TIGR02999 family)
MPGLADLIDCRRSLGTIGRVREEQEQEPGEVTRLLKRWTEGDASAIDALWPLVHEDLRRLARRQLASERGDHTLQRTALVNEAFIRLSGQRSVEWLNREQFLSLAAKIMRRVLVDYARKRGAVRRGDGAAHVSLHDTQAAFEVDEVQASADFDDDRVDVVAIDSALLRLEGIDATQSHIVELRYFGGLTLEQTADVVGISLASVKREWTMARAWLRRELTAG